MIHWGGYFFFKLAIGKSHFNLDSPIQRTNVAIRITGCSAFEAGNPPHINTHHSVSPTLSLTC